MKRIVSLIVLLIGLCGSTALAEVTPQQQEDLLMKAAKRFQEMFAKSPCGVENRAYVAKELRGKELSIGLDTRRFRNRYRVSPFNCLFKDGRGREYVTSGFKFTGNIALKEGNGLRLITFRVVDKKSYNILVLLPDGQQPIESVMTPLTFYMIFGKARDCRVKWSMPMGKLVFNPGKNASTLNITAGEKEPYKIEETKKKKMKNNGIFVPEIKDAGGVGPGAYGFAILDSPESRVFECKGPFGIVVTNPETGKVLLMGVVNNVPKKEW
ncbi:MAG: hypothetical protein HDS64_08485 [Bacteroidales bacterium]|nr:hypothetical protein [Bacteroidales bacterium]